MKPIEDLPYVECLGNFANPKFRGQRMPPIEWENDPVKRRSMYQQIPIRVFDARSLPSPPTLKSHGFTLVSHKSNIFDFHDQGQVTGILYPEFGELIKQLTGCTDVIVTQHQYRNGYGNLPKDHPRRHRPTANGSEGNYAGIHSDVTPWSEPGWRKLVDGRHFQVYNLWCSTKRNEKIEVMPLSICDMTSVDPSDMICADSWGQSAQKARLVSYRLAHNENQKWYYFPRMESTEVLVFKQYDSMEELPNMRCTFHGAVNDRKIDDTAPLRETIEVRLLALYDTETEREARVLRFQTEIPATNPDGNVSSWKTTY